MSRRSSSARPAPGGWCFLTLFIRPEGEPESGELENYQIDGATFSIDGRPADKAELMRWLAGDGKNRPVPRVKLAGNFGMNAYVMCDSAEFFSEAM